MTTAIWEQHCCLPLRPDADLDQLARYQRAGGVFVSVNAGYAPHTSSDVLRLLHAWRARIAARPDLFVLANSLTDVAAAAASDRTAIAFDLEDSNPLDGDLDMIGRYYELGIRTMLPTYNGTNAAGHGCHANPDSGLTRYGADIVREMNQVRMVVDASHCSARTTADLCRLSTAPVIYSHSACLALHDHERNITDDQMRACADTGGVVGINAVGIFLGAGPATPQRFVDHLMHALDIVGIDHVGIGTDFCFDTSDVDDEVARHPDLFPPAYTECGSITFLPPEALPRVAELLAERGMTSAEIDAVCYRNFWRVAATIWH